MRLWKREVFPTSPALAVFRLCRTCCYLLCWGLLATGRWRRRADSCRCPAPAGPVWCWPFSSLSGSPSCLRGGCKSASRRPRWAAAAGWSGSRPETWTQNEAASGNHRYRRDQIQMLIAVTVEWMRRERLVPHNIPSEPPLTSLSLLERGRVRVLNTPLLENTTEAPLNKCH